MGTCRWGARTCWASTPARGTRVSSRVSASTCHLLHVVLLQRDPVPRHAGQPPRHVRHPRVVPAHVAVAEVVSEDEHDVGPRLLGRAGCSFSSNIWIYTKVSLVSVDSWKLDGEPIRGCHMLGWTHVGERNCNILHLKRSKWSITEDK